LSKLTGKRKVLQKDVVTTNRWGCGIAMLLFLGMIIAMIFAAATQ